MHVEKQKKKYFCKKIKWFIVSCLIFLVILNNYYGKSTLSFFHIFINFLLCSIAIYIILTTHKGKALISFVREATSEFKKVIWPTYQETLYTTLMIVMMTVLISLILWGLDNILIYFISFCTNLRF